MEQLNMNGVIRKTTDYNIFSTVYGNRDIDSNNVKKIINSIKICDLSEQNPIVVDTNYCIIDGQHRFTALQELNKPIFYVITGESNRTLEVVQLLNTASKKWLIPDYFHSYCHLGNENFIRLRDFLEKKNLTLPEYTDIANRQIHSKIKDGSLVFDTTTEIEILKSLPLYSAIKQTFPKLNTYLRRSIHYLSKNSNFEPSIFFKRLGAVPSNYLRLATSAVDALRTYEDIYNFNTSEKKRIKF